MKKKLTAIIIILAIIIGFFIIIINYNFSDFEEKGPSNYSYIFEGGNQNRVMKDNKLIIDSGAVDFKYNDNYVVFSVDTTYSLQPNEISKLNLKYYIYDVKKNLLIKNIDFIKFQKLIHEKSLEEIDITK